MLFGGGVGGERPAKRRRCGVFAEVRHACGSIARGPGDPLLPDRLFYHPYAS